MILKDYCTERPLLAIEVWSAEVETCNMRPFHPPLRLSIFYGSRDQRPPGSLLPKSKYPGNEVDRLNAKLYYIFIQIFTLRGISELLFTSDGLHGARKALLPSGKFYNKHTCREVSPGLDAPRVAGSFPNSPSEGRWVRGKLPATRDASNPGLTSLQVCLVFITCHFGKKYWRIYAF
jgi:hypothetical protein